MNENVPVSDVVELFRVLSWMENKKILVTIMNDQHLRMLSEYGGMSLEAKKHMIEGCESSLKNMYCFSGAPSDNNKKDLAGIKAFGDFLRKIFIVNTESMTSP